MRVSELNRDLGGISQSSEDTIVLGDGTEITSIKYEDGKIVLGTDEAEAPAVVLGHADVMHQAVQSEEVIEAVEAENEEFNARTAAWNSGQGQEYSADPTQPGNAPGVSNPIAAEKDEDAEPPTEEPTAKKGKAKG